MSSFPFLIICWNFSYKNKLGTFARLRSVPGAADLLIGVIRRMRLGLFSLAAPVCCFPAKAQCSAQVACFKILSITFWKKRIAGKGAFFTVYKKKLSIQLDFEMSRRYRYLFDNLLFSFNLQKTRLVEPSNYRILSKCY